MKPTLNLVIRHTVAQEPFFQVVSTKDTTQYYPGAIIEERELKRIVQEKRTTVNIKEVKV